MSKEERTRENLNPHRPAKAAMWLFGSRYANYTGGSIDFWESLSDTDRAICRRLVDDIINAPEERATVENSVRQHD